MAGLCGLKILLLWVGMIGFVQCQGSGEVSSSSPPFSTATSAPPVTTESVKSSPPSTMAATTAMTSATQAAAPTLPRTAPNTTLIPSDQTFNATNSSASDSTSTNNPSTQTDSQNNVVPAATQATTTANKFVKSSPPSTMPAIAAMTSDTQAAAPKPSPTAPNTTLNPSGQTLSATNSSASDPTSTNNPSTQTDSQNKTTPAVTLPAITPTTTINTNTSVPSSTQDFLKEVNITPTAPTELPVTIETNLPPKCKGLSTDYTCWGSDNEPKKESELEPYTDYKCTGQVKDNNNNTITNTTVVPVRIDCGAVTRRIHPPGRTCNITGLKPYTDYTCKVHPLYKNDKRDAKQTPLMEKTNIGKPEKILDGKVTPSQPEHNAIRVTCSYDYNKLNDDRKERKFRAKLLLGDKVEREENKTTCEFEFKDLSYSTTYKVQLIVFNSKLESDPTDREFTTFYNDKAVIGFLVFLIILTSGALLFVIFKIVVLKRRKSHDLTENMMLISTTNDEENLLPVEPIAAEALLEAYKRKLADEGRLFLAEFQSIPRIFSRFTVKEAKKTYNGPKNRYVDILPYDYNRVQLTTGNGEPGCDYINASYIDGYKEAKKYIAAQGPKEETVGDFWRMVWEQQSSIIVMVTRCEEGNRVKCAQYWPSPEREAEIFAEFIVKLTSEDHCPDYTIRHLSLINKKDKNTEREVTHIQFMSWPDHGVPGEPHLLLKLRRRVNAFKNSSVAPSSSTAGKDEVPAQGQLTRNAGVGRTGTYIGIDAMMEGLEAEGRVDVYGYVVRLRRQRCLMVQVEAQYILIHQALVEHNQFGETEISLSELHSTLSTLKQKGDEPTLMEEEFERLPSYKNWRTSNTGVTEENKKKNRTSSVMPYDYNRVMLKVDEGHSRDSEPDEEEEEESSDEEDEDSTKYINASYIQGYWGPRALIAAQTPLPDTMADFLLMVYQKRASTIVMLSDCSEGDQESDGTYWGKDKKTFGDFEVEVVSTDITPTFICRDMLIRHVKRKDSRSVKQFQFLKWGNSEVPEKAEDLTGMMKEIKHNKSHTAVVHCNDGSSRTGIFCAMWNLLDSANTEKLVDVFQVVKTLRKDRQSMVTSLEQYQFLYDALEGLFPVQNGEVKTAQASAADSVQIVNETKVAEQPAEEKAEQPAAAAGTTSNEQQVAAENTPLVPDGGNEDKKEEAEKESSASTETMPLEDTSNGSTVTVEQCLRLSQFPGLRGQKKLLYLCHALVFFDRNKLVVHAVNQQSGHCELSVVNLIPLRPSVLLEKAPGQQWGQAVEHTGGQVEDGAEAGLQSCGTTSVDHHHLVDLLWILVSQE
ncbi:hypothetical protein INR49_025316, partial [Caranx melampygus]